jgi:hypothetical protein
MEILAAIFIVIALGATILVKYITTVRTMRFREQLLAVEGDLRAIRGKAKQAETQKMAIKRDLRQAQRQRKAIEKQTKAAETEPSNLRK